ncbi:MAG: hypothetical protein KIS66_18035 [Fimbriimonadaceae bacterium]|nr:hypothetical protein [Fimbriimonadaceae bacterium]
MLLTALLAFGASMVLQNDTIARGEPAWDLNYVPDGIWNPMFLGFGSTKLLGGAQIGFLEVNTHPSASRDGERHALVVFGSGPTPYVRSFRSFADLGDLLRVESPTDALSAVRILTSPVAQGLLQDALDATVYDEALEACRRLDLSGDHFLGNEKARADRQRDSTPTDLGVVEDADWVRTRAFPPRVRAVEGGYTIERCLLGRVGQAGAEKTYRVLSVRETLSRSRGGVWTYLRDRDPRVLGEIAGVSSRRRANVWADGFPGPPSVGADLTRAEAADAWRDGSFFYFPGLTLKALTCWGRYTPGPLRPGWAITGFFGGLPEMEVVAAAYSRDPAPAVRTVRSFADLADLLTIGSDADALSAVRILTSPIVQGRWVGASLEGGAYDRVVEACRARDLDKDHFLGSQRSLDTGRSRFAGTAVGVVPDEFWGRVGASPPKVSRLDSGYLVDRCLLARERSATGEKAFRALRVRERLTRDRRGAWRYAIEPQPAVLGEFRLGAKGGAVGVGAVPAPEPKSAGTFGWSGDLYEASFLDPPDRLAVGRQTSARSSESLRYAIVTAGQARPILSLADAVGLVRIVSAEAALDFVRLQTCPGADLEGEWLIRTLVESDMCRDVIPESLKDDPLFRAVARNPFLARWTSDPPVASLPFDRETLAIVVPDEAMREINLYPWVQGTAGESWKVHRAVGVPRADLGEVRVFKVEERVERNGSYRLTEFKPAGTIRLPPSSSGASRGSLPKEKSRCR